MHTEPKCPCAYRKRARMTRESRVKRSVAGLAAVVAMLAGGLQAAPQTQATGIVSGRVVDATRGEALPGALVRVEGTATSTPTDRQGAFRLTGLPVGTQTL